MKVLSGGCFDIITSGHIFFISAISKLGSRLVLNVVPDAMVRKKKGGDRPIRSQFDRMATIAAINGVDEVTCIEHDCETQTEYEMVLIDRIKPDIIVTGNKDPMLAEFCKQSGVILFPLPEINGVDKTHTTDLIKKIRDINYCGVNFVLLNESDEILVQKRDSGEGKDITNRNSYAFPGGGIEDGESVFEALSREFSEELGFSAPMPFKAFDFYYRMRGKPVVNKFFVFKVSGHPNIRSSEGEMVWMSRGEIANTKMAFDEQNLLTEI